MGQIIREQFRFFLIALATGLLLRCFYDGFLLWRRICKHSFFWIGVEDALYWFFCCIFVFSLFYRENDGIIRGFVLVGVFGGMLIYHAGPSYYVVEGFFRIYQILKRFLNAIWKFVSHPFHWVLKKIVRITKKIYKNLLQKYKNCFTLKLHDKKMNKKSNKKLKRKEQMEVIHGGKNQTDKKRSSKGKKSREKRRKKATDIGNSVSCRTVRSDADSLYISERKASRE